MPRSLDVLRPRGQKDHEVSIEIEHVVPVAQGGSGGVNLKLACGWCNRAKKAMTSIYDTGFEPKRPRLVPPLTIKGQPIRELPEPFWTVRVIAVQGRCQVAGCTATRATSELRLALKDLSGAPNPTNMYAVCPQHDPYGADRFQPRAKVTALWAGA